MNVVLTVVVGLLLFVFNIRLAIQGWRSMKKCDESFARLRQVSGGNTHEQYRNE